MSDKKVFLFDLDSTITKAEILPSIAEKFGVASEMRDLTERTMVGEIEFEESFRKRVGLLSDISVSEVSKLVAEIPLNERVVEFIRENKDKCYVVTNNLNVWIMGLMEKIGIADHCVCSTATVVDDKIVGIETISSKEDTTQEFIDKGLTVVAVGDGSNDRGMLNEAHIGIAFGGVRPISPLLFPVADYAVYDEGILKRLLSSINNPESNDTKRTAVISCAGMGTRLKMGIPKALVDIDGISLIERNLDFLKDEPDVRIAVGFKAEDVIEHVIKIRRDILFVFNHDYMNNGTGASVTLAKRYSGQYILTIDGDLLIHPNDASLILEQTEPFIGVCEASTDDPMLTKVGKNNMVVDFLRGDGQFEWTGVSLSRASELPDGDHHACDLLRSCLPMRYLFIHTKEIDTPNDYKNAEYWVKNNFSDNPTIGIVGGMGSYATADFFRRVLDAFPAEKEWDRPRIIVDNHCNMPSRVRAFLYNERKAELVKSLSDSVAMMLDSNATDIIFACDASHLFIDDVCEIIPEARGKIRNIIEICADYIKNRGIKEVRLLGSEGTIDSGVYQKYLGNVKCLTPTEEEYGRIRNWIEAVKQNKITDDIKNDFIGKINESDVPVIVGCTELPILMEACGLSDDKRIINPLGCTLAELQNEG